MPAARAGSPANTKTAADRVRLSFALFDTEGVGLVNLLGQGAEALQEFRDPAPSVGAVVSQFKGYDNGYKGIVPPYIIMTQAQGRFSEAGFLGPKAKPFVTGGDPARTPFMVEGIVAKGITDDRQRKRRKLMHDLDLLGKASPATPQFDKLDKCEENAYDMMFGDARNLFDLKKTLGSTRFRKKSPAAD